MSARPLGLQAEGRGLMLVRNALIDWGTEDARP